MKKLLALAIMVLFIVVANPCLGGIPHLISYQGMLTDNDGKPLNDSYNLTFKIYSQSSGGIALWTETQNGVSVENGLFNVILGNDTPIPSSVFTDTLRYLGITVGSDSELSPRIRLTSVGYAYRAEIADTAFYAIEAVSAETDGDWTISGSNIYSAVDGSVGIGTTNPEARFHSLGSWIIGITNSILPEDWGYGFKGWLTSDNGIRYEGAGDSIAHLFTTYGTGDIAWFGKSSEQGQEVNVEFAISNNGNVGIGTTNPTGELDVNGNDIRIRSSQTPASSSADGYTGEIAWDASYIYICTSGDGPGGGIDTWKRAVLSTW